MIDAKIAGLVIVLIGTYGLMTKSNLIKQVICVNVFSIGVVLFFMGVGYVEGGEFPISSGTSSVDPIPAVLMITTLVVDVAITSVALALIIRMNQYEGGDLET
ncbi:MAG: cation:proton antiporter subunit C [Candidatus Aenigmatarchaeota archaeon]